MTRSVSITRITICASAVVLFWALPNAHFDVLARPQSVTLTREPYIQKLSADSAAIVWKTDIESDSRVDYGPSPSYGLAASNSEPDTFHVVELKGLQSNTLYHYRISSGGTQLTEDRAFRTAPAPGDDRFHSYGFFVIGDGGSGDSSQRRVRDQIQVLVDSGKTDFGLYVGDIVYSNGEEVKQDPKFFTPYASIIDKVCWWTVLGNHDIRREDGAPYFRNRVLPVPEQFADPVFPERWYSFDYGSAHFIALDSNESGNPTQMQFLQWDLERNRDKAWIFVFLHFPPYATPYTDASSCSHMSTMEVRQNWCPLFEEYGVDMVFAGHNHTYQRSQLRRDFHPDSRGVYYIISGAGGEGGHTIDISDSVCNDPPLTQAFVQGETYHLVYVRIEDDVLSLQAIDDSGNVFDTLQFEKQLAVPVELVAFGARQRAHEVVLTWQTVSETNNAGFEVQRRTNFGPFRKIGYVNGTGTSSTTRTYRFVDTSVAPGTYFYRLRQIAADGSSRLSETLTVQVEPAAGFELLQSYPNPLSVTKDRASSSKLTYRVPSTTRVVFKVYDIRGREIRTLLDGSKPAGEYRIVWDGRNKVGEVVPSGIYWIRMTAGAETLSRRVTIVR